METAVDVRSEDCPLTMEPGEELTVGGTRAELTVTRSEPEYTAAEFVEVSVTE